jgi:pumilio family protein 6
LFIGGRASLIVRFNATQKTALTQALFHHLVLEYLQCAYRFLSAEEADKKMHELLTT